MLVRVQCRGAAAVGSRHQWARVGRWVNADASPIVVLQPFGPVRFLYEVGDTSGDALPAEKTSVLFAKGPLEREQYDRTRTAAAKYGIEVNETDNYGSLLAGTAAALKQLPDAFVLGTKNAARFRVKLNAKHDLPTYSPPSATSWGTSTADTSAVTTKADGPIAQGCRMSSESSKRRRSHGWCASASGSNRAQRTICATSRPPSTSRESACMRSSIRPIGSSHEPRRSSAHAPEGGSHTETLPRNLCNVAPARRCHFTHTLTTCFTYAERPY
jgi:hypothetical protein